MHQGTGVGQPEQHCVQGQRKSPGRQDKGDHGGLLGEAHHSTLEKLLPQHLPTQGPTYGGRGTRRLLGCVYMHRHPEDGRHAAGRGRRGHPEAPEDLARSRLLLILFRFLS